MKITDLGMIIGERELDGFTDGKPCTVKVKVGKPFPDPAGRPWYCPYCITTPKGETMHFAAGEDSLQALRLALFIIGAELDTIKTGLKLAWLGQNDLGFPNQA